jgi:hypothetical protein
MPQFQVQAEWPNGDAATFVRDGLTERDVALALDGERLPEAEDATLRIAPLAQPRERKTRLRADQLLAGDVVRLDGEAWSIVRVKVTHRVVRLVLVPVRWVPELTRETMVEVVSQVPRHTPTRR